MHQQHLDAMKGIMGEMHGQGLQNRAALDRLANEHQARMARGEQSQHEFFKLMLTHQDRMAEILAKSGARSTEELAAFMQQIAAESQAQRDQLGQAVLHQGQAAGAAILQQG